MTDSFGARLRRRREEQGVELAAIAEQTKIKTSLLEALERDDVSQWPSGIFRRAFMRAYAHAIGLDPDVIVREFLEVHPEPDELAAAASAIATATDSARSDGPPPTRLRQMVGSAIGTLGRFRRSTPPPESPGAGARPRLEPPPVESQPAAEHRFHSGSPIAWDEGDAGAVAAPETPGGIGREAPAEAAALEAPAFDEPMREEAPLDLTALDEPRPAEPQPDPVRAHPAPFAPDPAAQAGMHEIDVTPPPAEPGEPAPPPFEPDFLAVAQLCTEFGRVEDPGAARRLLQHAAQVLDAAGLIIWIWDGIAEHLRPALVHGYSERVVAQLPAVGPDDDNATAAAFRSAQPCVIGASEHTCSALALPLLTPGGCAGVLAIELPPGRERSRSVRAAATILAAVLAQLAGGTATESRPAATSLPPPAVRPRAQPAARLERA